MKTRLLAWITFLISAVAEWDFDINLLLNRPLWLAMAGVVCFATQAPAALTTNVWTSVNGGKWESANWSMGVPSLSQAAVGITNSFGPAVFSKSVIIDATTASTAPGSMTISNLFISGPVVHVGLQSQQGLNELIITNAGTFTVLENILLTTGSVMVVSNSTVSVKNAVIDDGYLELDKGATLLSTNSPTLYGSWVGYNRTAQMAVTGGIWIASDLIVGNYPGSAGLLEFSSGTISVVGGQMDLGEYGGASGTITMSGGTMNVPYVETIYLGFLEAATGSLFMSGGNWISPASTAVLAGGSQLNVSGGTFNMGAVEFDDGGTGENAGTFTISGGTCLLQGLDLDPYAYLFGSSSNPPVVWLTGGQLSTPLYIGAGEMIVSNGLWLATQVSVDEGSLTMAGGTTTVSGGFYVGYDLQSTGAVWLTGGQLTTPTNAQIGVSGVGQMTVSNGTWNPSAISVGVTNGSYGNLTIDGGTNIFVGAVPMIFIARNATATGNVWVTGGELLLTNLVTEIGVGEYGNGTFIQSNGVVQTYEEVVGINAGSTGQLVVAGGTHIGGTLVVGEVGGASGTASLSGGELITTNDDEGGTYVGLYGVGRINVSGGTWQAHAVSVATRIDSAGTLTFSGGITTMSNLIIGDCGLGTEGFLILDSGDVFVTNASHNATLDVRDGWVLLNGGHLTVDRLVMTNECGLFFHDAGSLTVGSMLLDPNLDADDDGLPNGWEQAHGLDPLSSVGDNGPDGDPDHDGFTNLDEYQAGTDPQNFNSTPLQFTSIVPQGNNVLVTWLTTGGKTNVVQFTNGTANGSYSNNFSDLSPVIVPDGVGLTSTNYLDVGGATNFPARYYRVRLVP
jgi:hypothetical protein